MTKFKFTELETKFEDEKTFVVRIQKGITSKEELLKILANELKFPDYFGFNWDALVDCLEDFSWLSEEKIVLLHEDVPLLGQEQTMYLDILNEAILSWEDGLDHEFQVFFPKEKEVEVKTLM